MPPKVVAALTTAFALGGVGYLACALLRTRQFASRRLEEPRGFPSVVILKPLCGYEEQLEENLRSFCEQDYPAFDVIFGVRDPQDIAAGVARDVVAQFPTRARLVAGDGSPDKGNPKVANLARMSGGLTQDVVVIADADMRVTPGYLRAIVEPLGDPQIGVVTCLYAGSAHGGVASQLAAMYVNEQFAPSVLVAQAIEPLRYAFGATIALRRSLLERIGGFAALAGHVADDHLLGRLATEHQSGVRLSRYVVENVMYEPGFGTMWARELRWSRTIRSVRPIGHAFSFLTFGLPLAVLAALVAPGAKTAVLLGAATTLRLWLHRETRAAFGVHPKAASAFLVPLRDSISFAVWLAAFCGRRVSWRRQQLQLDSDGEIVPAY